MAAARDVSFESRMLVNGPVDVVIHLEDEQCLEPASVAWPAQP